LSRDHLDFCHGLPAAVTSVIQVSSLKKTYGSLTAVDDVSFEVEEGEIFGLLGPNGAGKTTTMECVEGVRQPDAGSIRVLGRDPATRSTDLLNRIGVQLQEAQLQKRIKVWEAVDLWTTLFPNTVDGEKLLEELGLAEKRNARFMNLSGGQKQRLFIALALINDPEVVFLDELTTGLDPQARRTIWELVLGIKKRGKTVFLTTHLMEEAERLCDRVAVIERGRLLELGTAAELIARHCPERSVFLSSDDDVSTEAFSGVPGIVNVSAETGSLHLVGTGPDFVSGVIECIADQRIRVNDLRTETQNLEDVFLKLTGHSIRD
jgi:ABC-2 type transport system ATP-binding protein